MFTSLILMSIGAWGADITVGGAAPYVMLARSLRHEGVLLNFEGVYDPGSVSPMGEVSIMIKSDAPTIEKVVAAVPGGGADPVAAIPVVSTIGERLLLSAFASAPKQQNPLDEVISFPVSEMSLTDAVRELTAVLSEKTSCSVSTMPIAPTLVVVTLSSKAASARTHLTEWLDEDKRGLVWDLLDMSPTTPGKCSWMLQLVKVWNAGQEEEFARPTDFPFADESPVTAVPASGGE